MSSRGNFFELPKVKTDGKRGNIFSPVYSRDFKGKLRKLKGDGLRVNSKSSTNEATS